MSRRLIRSLTAGGCCVQRDNGDGLVYRSRDLRKSVIGILPENRIIALKQAGDLVSESHRGVARLVWSKCPPNRQSSTSTPFDCPNRLRIRRPRRSLFQRMLQKIGPPSHRQAVAGAVDQWCRDVAQAEQATAPAGMNWAAIETGIRLDRQYKGKPREQNYCIAIKRLDDIRQRITKRQHALIEDMLLDQRSRNAVASRSGMTLADTEQQAMAVLQQLVKVYRG